MIELLGGVLLFSLGWWLGCRTGFDRGVGAFILHLEEHGWKMEEDENGELTGKPLPKYGEHWYERRSHE